ncbi:DUF2501 domain-containing protein, partial [Salmonella enterica subsp. enterica serovar Kentucky]|nr:DUF2501 domain-containing protein [Salmonella enterica subsp. enterica serovar Kentucky]
NGLQGLLKTKDGQQLNLNNIGSTPLAEKVKTKACDLVLQQGLIDAPAPPHLYLSHHSH